MSLVRRPRVATQAPARPLWPGIAALVLVGSAVFARMAEVRAARAQDEVALPPLARTAYAPPIDATPRPTPAASAVAVTPTPTWPPFRAVATPTRPFSPPRYAPSADSRAERDAARRHAPVLIVDLARPSAPADAASPDPAPGDTGPVLLARATSTTAPPATRPDAPPPADTDTPERFAARVGGQSVEVATAERMTGLDRTVPQGTIIGGVLETAINSDLPGYVRAIVSRDVLSFDGTATLIPAGSRLIGQYASGVARGAGRVFIVWTRLIRPDGVSVALGSPGVDELGQGGLGGKVNRHFLERYGGAILLSVLSGGINVGAAALSSGSTVIVGTAGEAGQLASQAASGRDIAPTIRTPQGALVRIFVARDLDFSAVGPAR